MVELRHDLHAHPELAFQEHRTTQRHHAIGFVELGFEMRPCPTETGAVARPRRRQAGQRVMVRADIDGLPVNEESGSRFRSVNDGVMHACGHDVHTAGLLGVADLLSRRRADSPGSSRCSSNRPKRRIGGATAMIEGGVLMTIPSTSSSVRT
jgi:metal-dependent amidase/aminoacylase/carboxypeptidase family protein